MKLDWRLTASTIILWIILLPIFSLVHELGHAGICYYQGNEPQFHFSLILSAVSCSGNFSDNPGYASSFRMAGGFVAASLALILFVSLKSVSTPKIKFAKIALVVIGVTQFFNMVMETFAHNFYINESSVMTMINTLGAMILLFILIYRNSPKTFKKTVGRLHREGQQAKEIPQNVFQRSIVDIIKGKKPKKRATNTSYKHETTFASLDLLKGDQDD